jgi:hypothetical protein
VGQKEGEVKKSQQVFAHSIHPEGKRFLAEKAPDEQEEKDKDEPGGEPTGILGVKGEGNNQAEKKTHPSFPGGNLRQSERVIFTQSQESQEQDEEEEKRGRRIEDEGD